MSSESYLWLKAIHLLGAFSWMAGLFYLPRLLVYHASTRIGSEASELFKVMERRLLVAIMRPAAVVTMGLGVWIGWSGEWFAGNQGWLWVKVGGVGGLCGVHLVLERHVSEFARDLRTHGGRYFRVLNEVPTVLLIVIVVMVVLKPI